MNTDNEYAVKVLNRLIETTLDSANGYRHAADGVDNPEFKTMFEERAGKREALGLRLQQEVRSFGGEPEDDQSLLGRIHNKFAELRGEIMGQDDKGVITEVERGEDVIKAKFKVASEDDALPPTTLGVVIDGYNAIKADHDSVSQIKHSMI